MARNLTLEQEEDLRTILAGLVEMARLAEMVNGKVARLGLQEVGPLLVRAPVGMMFSKVQETLIYGGAR